MEPQRSGMWPSSGRSSYGAVVFLSDDKSRETPDGGRPAVKPGDGATQPAVASPDPEKDHAAGRRCPPPERAERPAIRRRARTPQRIGPPNASFLKVGDETDARAAGRRLGTRTRPDERGWAPRRRGDKSVGEEGLDRCVAECVTRREVETQGMSRLRSCARTSADKAATWCADARAEEVDGLSRRSAGRKKETPGPYAGRSATGQIYQRRSR